MRNPLLEDRTSPHGPWVNTLARVRTCASRALPQASVWFDPLGGLVWLPHMGSFAFDWRREMYVPDPELE